jgi:hypothetical protein
VPPRHARSAGNKRYYDWKGERFWSVTTILSGGVPKPALLPWGIKMVAEGAVEAVRSGALVPMVEQDADAAVAFLKGLPWAKRDRAANLGTEIHEAIEILAQGKPWPDWPLPIRPHMDHFRAWAEAYAPEWIASEASVFSRSQAYAGTLDFIARIGGRTVIGDVKTGSGIYPEVAMQLAAYRHAEFIGLPDGTEQPMPAVEGAVALHLTADGYRLLEVDAGEAAFNAFLYAREVFRWQEETSKTAIGGEVPLPQEVAA